MAARRSAWRYGGLQLGSALDGPSNSPLGSALVGLGSLPLRSALYSLGSMTLGAVPNGLDG
jgi:hypothetical protein